MWTVYDVVKAVLFDDASIAKKIRQVSSPKEQKTLGRQVNNFNENI